MCDQPERPAYTERVMAYEDLKLRTKQLALGVIRFVEMLPADETTRILRRQLLRSGTSVGANHRAAARDCSEADFIGKMEVAEEEADESAYWLELHGETKRVDETVVGHRHREASKWVAIAVASINTARKSWANGTGKHATANE